MATGLFQSATFYATRTGSNIKSLAVTDLNGDGKPDVVAVDSAYGTVDVLLGDGSGGFVVAGSYLADASGAIAAGDLNGDGHPDVVVTNGKTIGVLFGDGSGGLSGPGFTPVVNASPRQSSLTVVTIADVNGDGRPDIVTAGPGYVDGDSYFLINNGNGGFSTTFGPVESAIAPSIAVADLNGDGKPDVVLADGVSLDIALSRSGGGFSGSGVPDFGNPRAVGVADLNGDGVPDLVVATVYNGVGVFLGKGGGSFSTETYYPAPAVDFTQTSLALADLNGDGKLDVVSVGASTHRPFVLLGNGAGGFSAATSYDLGQAVSSVVAADVNGDGRPDLLFAAGAGVEVVLGVACFCPGTRIGTPGGEVAVELLAAGDPVVTVSGAVRPVRWVGRRSYNRRFAVANPALWPVRIEAGALGDGVPGRDLVVSGEHALLLDGVLVPARHLVNGLTIRRERPSGDLRYLHLELDSHDAILAEGAAAETFLDDGSRGVFHNAAEAGRLHPDADGAGVFFAPRVEDGEVLAVIRRRLAARASAAA